MDYFIIIISILFTTAGNFVQKLAADRKSNGKERAGTLIDILYQPITFFAFFLMGLGAVFWLYVLSKIDVSIAYPFVSLSFVFIMLLSKFILKENIPKKRWIGIMLIIFGVLLVAKG